VHYAKTLRHWLHRFDLHEKEIAQMYNEEFVRMYRLYLSGSISNFTTGSLQLYQVLFQRPDVCVFPITRDHLYKQ
jgi:cyclopropane-fatty-acyl-phospholipid synthase